MRALIAVLALLACAPAWAEVGRYEAVVLHEGGRSAEGGSLRPRVLLLDTRDGHFWTWEENTLIRGGAGPDRFGTVLTYQGRLRPGEAPGEVMLPVPPAR